MVEGSIPEDIKKYVDTAAQIATVATPDTTATSESTAEPSTVGVLTPFEWGFTESFTIDHPQFGGTYRWINEVHSTSGFLHDAGEREFYKGYYQLENGDHALVRQINPPNQLMFIFKDSATGNFKAAQWYSIPNDDLTMNLTGVTFGGYGAYNPELHFHAFINL